MPAFFFNDTATTEIYTLPYTTLFRSTVGQANHVFHHQWNGGLRTMLADRTKGIRSEEHTSELQAPRDLVCRLFFLMIRRPPRSTLFPTRRSSDLLSARRIMCFIINGMAAFERCWRIVRRA